MIKQIITTTTLIAAAATIANAADYTIGAGAPAGSTARPSGTFALTEDSTINAYNTDNYGTGYDAAISGDYKLTFVGNRAGSGNSASSQVNLTGVLTVSTIEIQEKVRIGINNAAKDMTSAITLNGGQLDWRKNDTSSANITVQRGTVSYYEWSDNLTGVGLRIRNNLGGTITLNNTDASLKVGSAGNSKTISSIISGVGGLEFVARNDTTLTLSGENTFTGGVVVSGGTLKATSASALGSGNVTITGGSTYYTGAWATKTTNTAVGELEIAEGVTLNATTVNIILQEANKSANTVVGTGKFASGTTFVIDGDADTLGIVNGMVFSIFDSATIADVDVGNFSLGNQLAAGGWAMALNKENGTATFSIPEPSMFGLLAGLGALALVGARRRRK